MNAHKDWAGEDHRFDQELSTEIEAWRKQRQPIAVPRSIDRNVARMARHGIAETLQSSWLLSQSARLWLVILVFGAIGLAWLLSLQ